MAIIPLGSRVWHPNTQMAEWGGFDSIRSARGMWLTDSRGRRMIDAVASMWCNVWGHSDGRLVRAIARQARALQHAPLFNLTHAPAEELARRLVRIAPGMSRAFFSDNGSSAMEVAVKMAVQYWQNEGGRRPRIAALRGGYHGDTIGAMSVGYVPEFFSRFRGMAFRVARLPAPGGRPPRGMTGSDHAEACLGSIEARLARGDIAAMVMESGAQVAGGAVIYPDGFQRGVGRLCRRHGALLVLDEVATGLGRLGAMAQYEAQGCSPDIVAYGKMLTGGYLTMAATLATKRVYDAFLGGFGRRLFHGHTYTGNPLAAAAANENLRMYRERGLLRRVRESSRILGGARDGLLSIGAVRDVRHRGMLVGIEVDPRMIPAGRSPNRAFYEAGRRNGIYLRTLGNVVLLVPPLAMGAAEIGTMVDRAARTIRDVARGA